MFSNQHSTLVKRLLVLLFAYFLCRIIFLVCNANLLSGVHFTAVIACLFYGIRFDIFSILITNALLILGHIIPNKHFYSQQYQRFLKFVFLLFNIPALIFNCIDFVYFRFTQKRTTSDFFTSEMTSDLRNNVLIYLRDFWYILLIAALLIYFINYAYNKIKVFPGNKMPLWTSIGAFLLSIFIFIVGSRGGLQYKPVSMQSAARYVPQQLIQATLNTPFTIIKTRSMEELPEALYMSQEQAELLFPIHHSMHHDVFSRKNVVVLIMESFSKEYCGYFNNGIGYTPFLDSLCAKAMVCTNAFANAKRSIEGIPAITASIPNLMNESFISSAYNTNSINGIGTLLNEKSYHTYFFHGGNNGTMGFESFSPFAGFEKYLGRNEYTGPASDYDGNWGIYDEPFLNFFNTKISDAPQPFAAALFTLSSHHPYTIPAKYLYKFPAEKEPVYPSVRYADFALSTFFEKASQEPWFANTLFIITADHTGPSFTPKGSTSKGAFEIPVIYYCAGDSMLKGKYSNATQQTDILPSLLDYLGFSGKYSAFGESIFSIHEPFVINYANGLYQGINNEYILLFDADNNATVGYYHYTVDSLLQNNIYHSGTSAEKNLLLKTEAAIQQYCRAMKQNKIVEK
jgi:phosphoglycerol transferase MdoB-like AlkP superfamily enzyme